MAQKISELTAAGALTGTEQVPVNQGGVTVRTTAQAIAGLGSAAGQRIVVACSDETSGLSTGVAKVTFHWPFTGTVSEIWVGLTTPQVSGSLLTVDVNDGGVSMLSTKVTVDNGEETSLTAFTPPVLSDTAVTKGNKATIDIDQVGDGTAKGLKVYITVVPT